MKVFISHSSSDHDFVWKLADRLLQDGIGVWVDEWEIRVGDSIVQKVNQAISESSFLLIVLSENSIESDWVIKEMNVGLMRQLSSKNIKVLPILLEIRARDLPPLLSDVYAVRFTRDTINDAEYKKLLEPIIEEQQTDSMGQYQDHFFENVQHIDIIIDKDNPTNQEVKFVLGLIHDDHYYNYFFKKVDKIHWFYPLKAQGYFEPSEKVMPKEVEQGSFQIPFWPVTEYLVKVSEKTIVPEYSAYADELISVIKKITEYHVRNSRPLDNFRMWGSFIKIFLNIPNDKISIDTLRLCAEWLPSKFRTLSNSADLVSKLLPKFLKSHQKEDHEKAELLLNISTKINWIPDVRTNEAEPKVKTVPVTAVESYWLIKSLGTILDLIAEKCSTKFLRHLSNSIIEILNYQRNITWREFNSHAENITIIARKINSYDFSVEIGETIRSETKEDQLELEATPPKITNITKYNLFRCLARADFVDQLLSETITQDKYNFLTEDPANYIGPLYDSLFEDYSYIWFSSLYDSPRTREKDPELALIRILRDVLSAKIKLRSEGITEAVENFLELKYPIFVRVVLYSIALDYSSFRKLFVRLLKDSDRIRLFESSNYQPELSELLKRNHEHFKKEEIELIRQIISEGPKHYLPDDDKEKYKAYWQIKWLSPIKSIPVFNTMLEHNKTIIEVDEKKIKYKSETIVRSGPSPSPISIEQMDRMTVSEIAKYCLQFQTTNDWDGPSVDGLSIMLKQVIINNPKKYENNLNEFLSCGYIYVYQIVAAFREVWDKKTEINWYSLLNLLYKYITQDGFWEDDLIVERGKWLASATSHWVAGTTAELIENGMKNDMWAIPLNLTTNAELILVNILANLKKEKEQSEISDFVTYGLNSTVGKSLSALIMLSLRIERNKKSLGDYKGKTWENGLQLIYDEFLSDEYIESFTWLGRYAPYFFYLGKEWWLRWAKNIQESIGSVKWKAFISGYLSIPSVYDELYHILRKSYRYGIDNKFPDEHDNEYIVQHIAIAYLRGKENLHNEQDLIRILIERWDIEQIIEIVDFFAMEHQDGSKEQSIIILRIVDFWRFIFNQKLSPELLKNPSDEIEKLLSRLSRLTKHLDSINEEQYTWLVHIAKYVHVGYNTSFFIESLDKYDDKSTLNYVGLLYLEMLKYSTPDYDKKHIVSTVKKLYATGYKDNANLICSEYGRKGFEFLRELYEANK